MATHDNQLIELLPARDRLRFNAVCELVELELSAVLCEAGEAARHVYFPTEGFISLLTVIEGGQRLEVGMVGREGMLGAHLALGVTTSPLQALVQGAGVALRVSAVAFRAELTRSVALQKLLYRYLYVRMAQLAIASACSRFHLIGPRLARWLLMSHDRALTERFRMTHEFLAYMLGVRRVGVTTAAAALQRQGLISYHRGEIVVLDRPGLELAACSCYAADRRVYAQRLGAVRDSDEHA